MEYGKAFIRNASDEQKRTGFEALGSTKTNLESIILEERVIKSLNISYLTMNNKSSHLLLIACLSILLNLYFALKKTNLLFYLVITGVNKGILSSLTIKQSNKSP
jgi:hypothetical protein